MNTSYPTDLTDKQRQVIEKVINPQERARKHSLRNIMNAILYCINKTDCQWRLLPREFGPWQTVYCYFRKWKLEGMSEKQVLKQVAKNQNMKRANHLQSTG